MDTPNPTPPPPRPQGVSLYLRVDGTLLIVRDGPAIEMTLTPRQLLELGMDALQLAAAGEPLLMDDVAEVMSRTQLKIASEAHHGTH